MAQWQFSNCKALRIGPVSDVWKRAAEQARLDQVRALARPVYLEELAKLRGPVSDAQAAEFWRASQAAVVLSDNPEADAAALVQRQQARAARKTPKFWRAKD